MRRLSFIFVVFFAIPSGYTLDYAQDVRPFLQTYCIECHGGKKVKGKVDFTKMKTDADLSAAFETWEAAIELLKEGEMPPDAAKQPSAANLDVIYQWYQQRFVESVKAHPGYFKPRRLSAWDTTHPTFAVWLRHGNSGHRSATNRHREIVGHETPANRSAGEERLQERYLG